MIDADGAIQEAADGADLDTRSDFFRKSIYAGGTLAAGGLLMRGMPALANAKFGQAGHQDPQLRAHARIRRGGVLQAGDVRQRPVGRGQQSRPEHQRARACACRVPQEGARQQGGQVPEVRLRRHRDGPEQVPGHGVRAREHRCRGLPRQAGRIKNPAYLGAAATILTVEARHAGAIAQLTHKKVSPSGSFDKGKSIAAILKAVKGTGFITS